MKHIYDLINFKDKISGKRLIVVNAHDETVLTAVFKASEMALIKPILIGDKDKINEIIKKDKLNFTNETIIDIKDDVLSAETAVQMIKEGNGDFLMKGLISTNVLLSAVVNREKGIRKHNILSHVTALKFSNVNNVVFVSDCAMIPNPTIEQKIEIIENTMLVTNKLNITNPKIALISAVEKLNPRIQSSVDAVEIVNYYKDKNPSLLIDGPFAIDNVFSKEAAEIKSITSEVANEPDIIIVPNIDAGNVFYKTSVYIANALAASIIVGAKVPIILTSRADSFESKLYSILLAGVLSDET